jgi:hypothetical protein
VGLVSSSMHQAVCQRSSVRFSALHSIPSPPAALTQVPNSGSAEGPGVIKCEGGRGREVLGALHALYEDCKLNVLR